VKRRTFLQIAAVSAGSVWLGGSGSACGDDDASPRPDTAGDAIDDTVDPGPSGEDFFPQGVASGDPGSSRVILWTRAFDPALPEADLACRLEVARDEAFTELLELDGEGWAAVTAEAAYDHCVKVRVTDLEADTVYWYRFLYEAGGAWHASRAGRTRTAPGAGETRPVRFAVVSCQDYIGRYYNAIRRLMQLEPEFVLHLGDYVYETTGNPQFQDVDSPRRVEFTDPSGAIVFNAGTDSEYLAARTLGQYRDIYRIYRQDPDLQEAHARYPFIATWDDHEFTDDAWGANATYFFGRVDEEDVDRRKAASQAWFEYMPVDYPWDPDFRYDPAAPFPGDLRIHRDLTWGAHIHLVLPDVRTYRSAHVVSDGAWPGAVVVTEAELEALGMSEISAKGPYVDLDTYADGAYLPVLRAAQQAAGGDADQVGGLTSVQFINLVVDAAGDGAPAPISAEEQEDLPQGVAIHHIGKRDPHTMMGTRNLLVHDAFRAYAAKRWAESGGASEDMLGAEQEAWFVDTLKGSDRTWKIWANAFPLTDMVIDLRAVSAIPPALAQRFLLIAEDWAGFPNRRDQLLETLAEVDNLVVLTGDRHAFLVGTPHPWDNPDAKVPEFVTGCVSSTTYGAIVFDFAMSDPVLRDAGAVALALALRSFLLDRDTSANPHMANALLNEHGFGLVEASQDRLTTTIHYIHESEAAARLEDPEPKFSAESYVVLPEQRELWREVDGSLERWDLATEDWEPST